MNDEDPAALGGEQLEPQPPQENAPAQTDAELSLETRLVALEHAREGLASAKQERGLRKRFAIGAVIVMIAQIVAVVLVVMNYLFPKGGLPRGQAS